MFRAALALVLAAMLAFAPAAPARADSRDVAKVIGGLIALYALKEALDHRRESRAAPVQRRQAAPIRPRDVAPARPRQNPTSPRPQQRPYPLPRDDVRLLPDSCHVTHRTAWGRVAGYGARCMQNAVARPGLLPPECIRRVETDRGRRNIYDPGCMRTAGWSPRTALR
ncbi:hypothetical protein MWU52_13440 [Jannaschia sp. S6380]|uniref:hypothetical protein n=1 Tax=Jannaschia sp. S6380 TaxID=2926408 RepID=UPI001FF60CF9|nr:hypothetical protein [Jannaschia sp. S6380]MCK0168563.1 hypothetical protein [Jannaschia sp. S6380]